VDDKIKVKGRQHYMQEVKRECRIQKLS